MQTALKKKMRKKVNRGLGMCHNSAEQNQPSRSQTLPNKWSVGGMPCFARSISSVQNRYWVTSTHSVYTGWVDHILRSKMRTDLKKERMRVCRKV